MSNKKTNGYNTNKLKAKRRLKRQEAEARQKAYDRLTVAEKFATLIEGGSKKQRAKLEKMVAAKVPEKQPAQAPATKKKKQ
jgi:hypothetical protein